MKKLLSFTSKISRIQCDWETVPLPMNKYQIAQENSILSGVAKVFLDFKNGMSLVVKVPTADAQRLVELARSGEEFEMSIEPKDSVKPKKKDRRKK